MLNLARAINDPQCGGLAFGYINNIFRPGAARIFSRSNAGYGADIEAAGRGSRAKHESSIKAGN
jgi:hypothetical protein